eukprot:gnl/MRDRNA2_/MRDRNA2_221765_c0_seq1.p1 gnl/MRDRNA2_/MRDRNA2_221765_c0~~gnl/MRDRNA2_/MRDRNA2_221765_c0_seq1.p1  ORF type:complete len:155 (+),score=27.34 gnl/MRDRNA2_/MRDRNA2_221765_c0_seq1:3-467(+)
MKYFLLIAENKTQEEDSYSSAGVIRRNTATDAEKATFEMPPSLPPNTSAGEWHPYTPFQMSTRESNDYTRMRKGGWWLRRGVRFDAMRYWYQFSDFARFPGLTYFDSIPDLLCKAKSLDIPSVTALMREYNAKTLVHSSAFWSHSLKVLVGKSV